MKLEQQSIDQLNDGLCLECRMVIGNMAIYSRIMLCPRCEEISNEMLRRLDARKVDKVSEASQ